MDKPLFTLCNDPQLMAISSNTSEINKHLRYFFDVNVVSDTDLFLLWSTHKAYIRRILIKLSSQAKPQRTRQMTELLDTINKLELVNKSNPTPATRNNIFKTRNKLRKLLTAKQDRWTQKLHATFYASGDTAGKHLAAQIKPRRTKQKIPYILHPSQGGKMYHLADIAKAFQAYYSALNNLKDDT